MWNKRKWAEFLCASRSLELIPFRNRFRRYLNTIYNPGGLWLQQWSTGNKTFFSLFKSIQELPSFQFHLGQVYRLHWINLPCQLFFLPNLWISAVSPQTPLLLIIPDCAFVILGLHQCSLTNIWGLHKTNTLTVLSNCVISGDNWLHQFYSYASE